VFGVLTGIASLLGLYFTLFQAFPHSKYASWSSLFLFSLIIAVIFVIISPVLRRRKFEHFSGKYYLEISTKGRVHLNSFTAICPWCGSKMNLCNVGPKDGPRDDLFVCERNPRQHTILLDPTLLPDIDD
jgi:hypothetical protein